MSIVLCPRAECARKLTVADADLATPIRCPHCGQVFQAPLSEARLDVPDPTLGDLPAPMLSTLPVPVRPLPGATQDEPAGLARPAVDSSLPPRLGRYDIRARLGEGAFGVVYRAHDPQLDREVALKVAKPHMLNTEARVKRFLREAKAAANLRHPNIVPVHDSGRDGDQYYIASAFIAGKSLAALLEELPEGRGLEIRKAAEIVRRLADALAYAHGKGVIHRDVKPANAMLDDQGEPLLMDFGLAARAEGDEKLTQEAAMLGTPAYMAPEQAAGKAEPASDQYSLGCTLYELLTGRTPFSGPPEIQIVLHRSQEPTSPRKINPSLPRDLETICLKCLAKNSRDRYRGCGELADDLRRWRDGEPIQARRLSLVERAGRWVRKEPRLAGSLLTVLLLLTTVAIGGPAAAVVINEAREEAVKREEEERKAKQEVERQKQEVETQKTQVEKQRDRAERWLKLSRGQVSRYIDLMHRIPRNSRLLGDTINFMKLEQELTDITDGFYREFEKEGGTIEDPGFAADMAEALFHLGDIAYELHLVTRDMPKLPPDFEEVLKVKWEVRSPVKALDTYHRAAQVLEKLVAAKPNARSRDNLAIAYNGLANVYAEGGKRQEAQTYNTRAIELRRRLLDEMPQPTIPVARRERNDRRANLAMSHQNLAQLHVLTGDLDKCLEHAQESLRLREANVRDSGDDQIFGFIYAVDLVGSYNVLGSYYHAKRQTAQCRDVFEKAVALLEKHAEQITLEEHQLLAAMVYCNLGHAYMNSKQTKQAEAPLLKGLGLLETLVQEHSAVPRYRASLARNYMRLSMIYLDDRPRMAECLKKSLAQQEKLPPDYEEDALPSADLGLAVGMMGMSLAEGGEYELGAQWCDRAVRRLERLAGKEEFVTVREALHHARIGRAMALAHLGRFADSLKDWDKVVQREDDPSVNYWRLWRAVSVAGQGDEYVKAVAEAIRLNSKAKVRDVGAAAAIESLASAAALKDKDPELTDVQRQRRSERYALTALDRLEIMAKRDYFKTREHREELKKSALFAPLRGREDFQKFVRQLEEEAP